MNSNNHDKKKKTTETDGAASTTLVIQCRRNCPLGSGQHLTEKLKITVWSQAKFTISVAEPTKFVCAPQSGNRYSREPTKPLVLESARFFALCLFCILAWALDLLFTDIALRASATFAVQRAEAKAS